ncbi:hypothetical protein DJ62_1605 [Yersinia enterocolitica]|nr:hypothetical protein DJ61_1211 [Yersinia enterocolitica]KGA66183.1 hypothetical protein DJ62_1605 [Yersinia enterocolitica]
MIVLSLIFQNDQQSLAFHNIFTPYSVVYVT